MSTSPSYLLVVCIMLSLMGFGGSVLAQPADTVRVNVATAIERALAQSPEVGQITAQEDFASARLSQARASRFLTEFTATSAHAPAPTVSNPNDVPTEQLYLDPDVRNDWDDLSMFNQVEAELLQPIYTWGELGGNIRAARHGVAVEAAEVRGKEIEVAARTGELYYNLLLTNALEQLTTEAGDIVERAKEEIDRLLQEGAQDVDDADLFEVQITEQEFRRRVVEVAEQQRLAQSALVRQLFLPEGTPLVAEDRFLEPLDFTPQPMEVYFEQGLTNRPELAQAAAGVAAREALVDVARSDYFPKLFLGARYRASGTPGRFRQPNPYISDGLRGSSLRAGLGMQLQLNFAQTRAKVEQAQAQRNEVSFQAEAARQLVLFEVEEAYRRLTIARAALDAQEEALRISKEWLRTEQVNFDLAIGDTENLVRAVRANLTLQAQRHEAVRDYNVAILRLMKATGTLTQQIASGILVDQS